MIAITAAEPVIPNDVKNWPKVEIVRPRFAAIRTPSDQIAV
jgi:hypothetical protein